MSTRTGVESLRPAAMQAKPVRVEHVFDDPDAVVDEIKARAPYPTMAAFHKLGGLGPALPWFRTTFDDELFLLNERWVEAAKRSFSAEIVQPLTCVLNINMATSIGAAHVDLPTFRGFAAPTVPVWLLMNMAYSGLFDDWMVPFASGLVWFYRGEGGGFEYWPDGPGNPSVVEEMPRWNEGVMSDNEFMWHRVEPIGTPADQTRFQNLIEYQHELDWADGRWKVRGRNDFVAAEPFDNVRISLLWKARVFTDEKHLASFRRTEMNLTTDQVVDLYLSDLDQKGVRAQRPTDPLRDPGWQSLLNDVYRPAFLR